MHHLLSLLCRLYCFLLAPSAAHYINGGPSLPPPLTPEQEKALLARLRDRLPKYMLPSVCRRLERFPQNRTGKIDRRALLILSKED